MTKNLWKKKTKKRHPNKSGRAIGYVLLISLLVFIIACQPPEPPKEPKFGEKSADITPTPNLNLTEFESELKSMRTADFDYIFALKRKDKAKFTSEDRQYVRENIHYATNRTSFIENDTILFIGSNYRHTDENIEALKKRFEFEDFSKSDDQIEKEQAEKKAEREKEQAEAEEAVNANAATQTDNSDK